MSDFRGIGAVSATLKTLLEDRLEPLGNDKVIVTVSTPDKDEDNKKTRVNLFLYKVSENSFLKNQEIPGQGSPGAYGRPPLSLDLHYLLTAYGSKSEGTDFINETQAHFLLGNAMRVLHDYPIITPTLLRVRDNVGQPILDLNLHGEYEKVKISLEPLSLEDLAKIWTALTLTYRLSAAYVVNVVQIDTRQPRMMPKPVGEPPAAGPRVYVTPFLNPQIQEIRVRRPAVGGQPEPERVYPYARLNDTLIIIGRNFGRKPLRVTLGPLQIPVTPMAADRLELAIPADADLPPGPQLVVVVVGAERLAQAGFASNQAVFMLVPLVSAIQKDPDTHRCTIRGSLLFHPNLTGEVLVGNACIAKEAYLAPSATAVTIPLPDTLPSWPVHCLISGQPQWSQVPENPELEVTLGSNPVKKYRVILGEKPSNLSQTAVRLQEGLRQADSDAVFRGARVALLEQNQRLVVVPGGLREDIAFAAGTAADSLGLSGGTKSRAYLSGVLQPFPTLTAQQPAVKLVIDGVEKPLTLGSLPTSLDEAAELLATAIQQAGAEPAFSQAKVTVLENQLLILPGGAQEVTFHSATQSDGTGDPTLGELGLEAHYPLRLRVNGAECLESLNLEMP